MDLRHLTQRVKLCYTPTKWRLYHDHRFCDFILPYVLMISSAVCENSFYVLGYNLFLCPCYGMETVHMRLNTIKDNSDIFPTGHCP